MELQEILESIQKKQITITHAKKLLDLYALQKIENIAQVDIGRSRRRGIPEVIFAESKKYDEIKKIVIKVLEKSDNVIISRLKKKDYTKIIEYAKKNKKKIDIGKNTTSIIIYNKKPKRFVGTVGIITAGTSDIGIGEEARLMCTAMKCKCICNYDVGVAGLQRIFPVLKEMISNNVKCIIVIAGMEGALATVVSTLSSVPVIGVPASVGYGYGEKGVAALASMLQSCALGLAVVNIDNGIGAGAIASQIAKKSD